MRKHLTILMAATATLLCAPVLLAQPDGLIAHPNVYKLQFENDWVRLIRINVPAGAVLAEHSHPPGVMVHLYLNDADPIVFEHPESPGIITRPSVAARSYRVGRAKPETHTVINRGRGASDYMRIEFKTAGDVALGRRVPAPPPRATTTATVEIANAMYRVTRVTVAARDSFAIVAGPGEPALLVALTLGVGVDGAGTLKIGQERFVDVGRREVIRNTGDAPVELLRVDFLTRPLASPFH